MRLFENSREALCQRILDGHWLLYIKIDHERCPVCFILDQICALRKMEGRFPNGDRNWGEKLEGEAKEDCISVIP